MESLVTVVETLKSVDSGIAALEERFADIECRCVSWSIKDIQEWEGKISNLVAVVDEFTTLNDSIMTRDEGEQGVKDEVESRTDSSSARLENLTNDLNTKRTVAAEKLKNLGNDEFKRGKFPAALALYEEAIVYDPTNAVLYTNRALVFQKIDNWTDALSDAEHAVSLDPDMLKGHIILIKCLIKLDCLAEVADAIDEVPETFQKRPELVDQKVAASNAAKDKGNMYLKAGEVDDAVAYYSLAINIDPSNHVFYSNRCAALQQQKMWNEGVADAQMVLELSPLFPKGHLHLARCLLQLNKFDDATMAVAKAKSVLGNKGDMLAVDGQLTELARQITAAANKVLESSPPIQAEILKGHGNKCYKAGEYQGAVRYYTQAISMMPEEGSYYGNRAATWIMLKEFQRAVDDCVAGIKLEKTAGELDKLRQRQASALVHMGKIDQAIALLKDAMTPPALPSSTSTSTSTAASAVVTSGSNKKGDDEGDKMVIDEDDDENDDDDDGDSDEEEDEDDEEEKSDSDSDDDGYSKIKHKQTLISKLSQMRKMQAKQKKAAEPPVQIVSERLKPFQAQIDALNSVKTTIGLAAESLKKKEFSRVKRLLATAQAGGASEDPVLHLMMAQTCLGLGELEECSKEAQKVILSCKGSMGSNSLLFDAYMVRGDALSGLGSTEQAGKYFSAALQLDPDHSEAARKYKALRKMISETMRIRAELDKALAARTYDTAISICTEGLSINKESKKLMVEFHLRRARVHKLIAKSHIAKAQAAASSSSSSGKNSNSSGSSESSTGTVTSPEDHTALAAASWKKCLQDCTSVMYFDSVSLDGVTGCILKLEALQGMDRFEEAITECEAHISFIKGKGLDMEELKGKLAEAKLLLKKSKRVNLYSILGVAKEHLATEQEIKTAYKKAALKWHPDRHCGSGEEKKKEAENRFKEIGDVYEILIDPTKKRLWDQGCDREELDQRAEYAKQGGGHGGGNSRGGHGGFGGFY